MVQALCSGTRLGRSPSSCHGEVVVVSAWLYVQRCSPQVFFNPSPLSPFVEVGPSSHHSPTSRDADMAPGTDADAPPPATSASRQALCTACQSPSRPASPSSTLASSSTSAEALRVFPGRVCNSLSLEHVSHCHTQFSSRPLPPARCKAGIPSASVAWLPGQRKRTENVAGGGGGPCRSRPPTGSPPLIAVGPRVSTVASPESPCRPPQCRSPPQTSVTLWAEPGGGRGSVPRPPRATEAALPPSSSRTPEAPTGHRHRVERRPSKLRVHQAL